MDTKKLFDLEKNRNQSDLSNDSSVSFLMISSPKVGSGRTGRMDGWMDGG